MRRPIKFKMRVRAGSGMRVAPSIFIGRALRRIFFIGAANKNRRRALFITAHSVAQRFCAAQSKQRWHILFTIFNRGLLRKKRNKRVRAKKNSITIHATTVDNLSNPPKAIIMTKNTS